MRDTWEESLLESVRLFFMECPLLEEGALVSADRTDSRARGYAVCAGKEEILRRYLDEGTLRAAAFDFCIRGAYGAHTRRMLEERRFLDALQEWAAGQNQKKRLPALTRGRRAVSLRAVSQEGPEDIGTDGALWRLRCRLVYFQPGRPPEAAPC